MKKFLIFFIFPFVCFSQNSLNMSLLGEYNYPNFLGNDIWGYVDSSGNEYAIVGLREGVSFVDVTDPTNPYEEFFIPDIYSIWRDIKTWGNYAYVTTESDTGLLIIDLSDMSGNTYYHKKVFNNPNGSSVEFTAAHNIYIDENGIAYIFGASSNTSSSPSNGAIFLDLTTDPINPTYLGEWDDYYVHDGMARGDTLYLGCIYNGDMYVVDVSDKANPQNLGNVSTPNNFTHNAWVSDNGDYVFTTDEKPGAYVGSFDISDLNNIQEVDRIQSNPGSNSIPHNTHVDGNFLITSYYRDGTVVHDITNPDHLVEVAYYDSYSGSGNGYDGCWGTYPFLPSGNIISSDRNSGSNNNARLMIYSREFQQACYLNGTIYDSSSGLAIANASIDIISTSNSANSNLLGFYKSSVLDSGNYQIVFSALGYENDTISATFNNGIPTTVDAYLTSSGGCTDSLALNYDSLATIDDSSCVYYTCTEPAPTNVFSSDIVDTKATVNWDNMNSSDCMVFKYVIRFREFGTNSWTTKSGGIGNGLCNFGLNNTSKTLRNLIPSTTYQYKIKAFYCNGGSSGWTLPKYFTTSADCPEMTNLSTQTYPLNTGKVTFSWDTTGSYVFARVVLRVNNSGAPWQTVGGFGVYFPTLSVNKFGLLSGVDYRAQGRTFCDSNITSYRSWWTPPIFWTQPGSPIKLAGGSIFESLEIFPNPSKGEFNLSFYSNEIDDYKISIKNIVGQEVSLIKLKNVIGEVNKKINTENLSSSVYIIELSNNNYTITKNLIIK